MSPYGVPMPSGVPGPQGIPMGAGAPMPSPAPAASPYGGGAPAAPMAAPAAASPMPPLAGPLGPPGPAGIGQNGFGIHPDVSVHELASTLLPGFKNVESSGDYKNYIGKSKGLAQDPTQTASGAYGYTDRTWNHYKGYPRAMDAPPEVQDERMKNDLTISLHRFGGDPFKAVVNHFHPASATDPTKWNSPPTDAYGKPIPNAQTPAQYAKRILPPERVDRYLSAVGGSNGGSNAAPL
jgi:hypothetical protein